MLRTLILTAAAMTLLQTAAYAQSSSVFSAAYVTASEVTKLADSGFDIRTAGSNGYSSVIRTGVPISVGDEVRARDAKPAGAETPAEISSRLRTVSAGQLGRVR